MWQVRSRCPQGVGSGCTRAGQKLARQPGLFEADDRADGTKQGGLKSEQGGLVRVPRSRASQGTGRCGQTGALEARQVPGRRIRRPAARRGGSATARTGPTVPGNGRVAVVAEENIVSLLNEDRQGSGLRLLLGLTYV